MPQDIAIVPQMSFADGTFAKFGDVIIGLKDKDEHGNETEVNEFHCIPTIRARVKHNIDENTSKDLDKSTGWFKKRYKKDWCICLDPSPKRAVWFLLCDFNGKYINPFESKINELIIEKERLVKENDKLNIAVAILEADRMEMLENPKKFFEKVLSVYPEFQVKTKDEGNEETGGGQ